MGGTAGAGMKYIRSTCSIGRNEDHVKVSMYNGVGPERPGRLLIRASTS